MRRVILSLALSLIAGITALGQPAQCRVNATFYLPGTTIPDKNATLTVFEVKLASYTYSRGRVVYRVNASGVLLGADGNPGVSWPQGALVTIYTNANAGLPGLAANPNAGTQYRVPNLTTAQIHELEYALTLWTTKGDLVIGGTNGKPTRFGVCPNGQTLIADTTQALGWRCDTPGAVLSVFGRTGAVVAQANDYTWSQINKSTSSLADITTRSASDLSSGTLPDARFPSTLPALNGSLLTNLNASALGSGTVPLARISGLTNAEIAAGAGIALSKLAITGTPDGTKFLRDDGSWQSTAGGMAIGGSITGATQGSVLFAGAGGVLSQNNPALFWDNTNIRLGINATAPAGQLDVRPMTTGTIGQVIRLPSGQTANALEIQNSTGTGLSAFTANGSLGIGTIAPGAAFEAKSGSDYIQLDPAAYKIRVFRAGQIDAQITVSAAGYSFNSGIVAAGKFIANNAAIGSSSTGSIGSTGAGILELRSANASAPFITFTESGSGDRGAFGFPAGSGNLVFNQGGPDLSSGTRRWLLTSDGRMTLSSAATTNPGTLEVPSLAGVSAYVKNAKLVFAYNNAGTITYISIPLDGSSTTWTHSTTAP